MGKERNLTLEEAFATWNEKGNKRLAEAVAVALETQRANLKKRDAA